VGFAHTWGEHRVFFREPNRTQVRSLLASWTDVEVPDAFLELAAGRAHLRVSDLLQLVAVLDELAGSVCK
jgi:hypothetical protein